MARYSKDIQTKKTNAEIETIIQEFMKKEGFKQVEYRDEMVWKKGKGILTAPQFLKSSIKNGKVVIEAWIKFAILPGVYGGEMNLSGFIGFAIKKVLRNRVETLENLIEE